MSHVCEIRDQEPQPALAMRRRTPIQGLPQALGEVYGAIAQYLGQMGEYPAGPPFVGYYNMDMSNLDVEIGFPTARALPGDAAIQPSQIPGGKVGICLHVGPYGEIGPAYEALTRTVWEAGYRPSGTAYEMYLNDPSLTPPDQLQTRILFPLAAADAESRAQ